MKTLIINGSPHKNGNTAFLVNELKKYLKGEVIELFAYDCNVKPCDGCGCCHKKVECSKKDDMQIIYNDDYDNVVIATPLFISSFPGPLKIIADRLQVYSSAKRFLGMDLKLRKKFGAAIIVGGGAGRPDKAIDIAKHMCNKLNASLDREKDIVTSLKTDTIPTSQDEEAINKVKDIANYLNSNCNN